MKSSCTALSICFFRSSSGGGSLPQLEDDLDGGFEDFAEEDASDDREMARAADHTRSWRARCGSGRS